MSGGLPWGSARIAWSRANRAAGRYSGLRLRRHMACVGNIVGSLVLESERVISWTGSRINHFLLCRGAWCACPSDCACRRPPPHLAQAFGWRLRRYGPPCRESNKERNNTLQKVSANTENRVQNHNYHMSNHSNHKHHDTKRHNQITITNTDMGAPGGRVHQWDPARRSSPRCAAHAPHAQREPECSHGADGIQEVRPRNYVMHTRTRSAAKVLAQAETRGPRESAWKQIKINNQKRRRKRNT